MTGFWSGVAKLLFGEPPDYPAIWAEVRDHFEDHQTSAWTPRCEDGPHPDRMSQFGGLPLLSADRPWPECGRCGDHLPLFLQLRSTEFPDGVAPSVPSGILQLFFCTKCFRWEPDSDAIVIRLLGTEEELEVASEPRASATIAHRAIIDWEKVLDYREPDDATLAELGLDEVEIDSFFEAGFPLHGDKLLGSPYWVQYPEFVPCPTCNKPMRHLFQIDSNVNLDFMWGDAGVAQIEWCPDHGSFALVWQCH